MSVVYFRGHPACECLAEWLPVFEQELLRRGVIEHSIDIAQLIGGAPASGGTHTSGGAFDIWQHDPVTQEVAREMGAAAWNRIPPWWSGSQHTHGVLNGCPHNGPARYQIDALADGYDGLGAGGRGARDYGPGPQHLRTWREGIQWAQAQEDDMANYAKQLDDMQAAIDEIRQNVAQIERRENRRDANTRKRLKTLLHKGAATKDDLEQILAALDDEPKED